MSDFDVIVDMQGLDVRFRVDVLAIPAMLVRASASDSDMALELVFDKASPEKLRNFYEYCRRRIGSNVTVSISGATFTGKLVDTTRLPAGYKTKDYLNTVFEFVFEYVNTKSASAVSRGMIALPVPNRIVKKWACKGLKTDPHITLAYMPKLDDDHATQLADIIRDIAKDIPPFRVITNGQGLFGANSRVALVATNPELKAFRNLVVARTVRKFPKLMDLDTHPHWMPHITLGQHDRLPKMTTDAEFILDTVDVNIDGGNVYSVPLKAM